MLIKTKRLTITDFTPDMAYDVHKNSLDEDNRRFVPDEVFETAEDAAEVIGFYSATIQTSATFSLFLLRKAGKSATISRNSSRATATLRRL